MTQSTLTRPETGHVIEYELLVPAEPAAGQVVFVAGMGNHRTLWERQQEHLARTHALLFVDNRGVSLSGSPSGLWSVQDQADDVLFVLQNCGWAGDPVHLVGHSLGALVCYEVLRRAAPSDGVDVHSLTILSASLSGTFPVCALRAAGLCKTLELLTSAPAYILRVSLELNYPRRWLEAPAEDGLAGTNADAAVRFLVRVLRGRRAVPAHTWLKQALSYATYRPSALRDVSALGVRVLVVGGDEDLLHSVASMRATAQRLGGRFVCLEGVGHNSFVQASGRVNRLLAEHFAGARTIGADVHSDGALL